MTLKMWLEKLSPALLVGLVLFLTFAVYAYAVNRDLKTRLTTRIEEVSRLSGENRRLAKTVELQNLFLGRRLPTVNILRRGGGLSLLDSIRAHKLTVMIFIIGGCPSCFEDEAELWNVLIDDVTKSNGFGVCINESLRRELVEQFERERLVRFRVLNDNGEFSEFLRPLRGSQVVALVIDSSLSVRRIHISVQQDLSTTTKFCKEVKAYLGSLE